MMFVSGSEPLKQLFKAELAEETVTEGGLRRLAGRKNNGSRCREEL